MLLPDLVYRGGADPSALPLMDKVMAPAESWFSYFPKAWAMVQLLQQVMPVMIFGSAPKAYPTILEYARAVRKDLPAGAKLGVAGFCWGGYGSTNLCKESAIEGNSEQRLIDVQFCGHPSFLKTPEMIVDAVSTYKVPYACAVAQEDNRFNEERALETLAALREKIGPPEKHNYHFEIYKGCSHGFCVRANPSHEADADGFHAASKQGIDWFNKYLK